MWRRHGTLALTAMALVVVGAVLALASALDWGNRTLVVTAGDVAVNEGAGDLGDIRAHNSPTIVRNPRDPDNLVVASRIDTPGFSCALHVSLDGGAHWRPTAVPIPPGEEPKCYAPDAAFGPGGTLHLSYVTLRGAGNVPHAVWMASSDDGGRTLSAPTRVFGELAFQVRLAADPERAGRLYMTWLQAREVGSLRFSEPGNRILSARSDDGGETWTRPVAVSAAGRDRVLAPVPAVGPAREVYVLYLDVGEDRLDYEGGHEGFGGPPYAGRFSLVLGRSQDGGRSWEEAVIDDRVVPIERFVAFLPPFPSLVVDRRSGRVFAAFHDGRHGSADVLVWSLAPDEGGPRGPVRVNDTSPSDRTAQYLPKLGVAPDGRLDVVYYDRRADRRNVRNEVSLQSSFDGGRTFTDRVPLSGRSFDSRIGFGVERGLPDLGSRLGLASGEAGAVAVWADTRHGTDASNKQDLMAGRATVVSASAAAADELRQAGIALVLGGLVSVGLALVRARSRRVGASRT